MSLTVSGQRSLSGDKILALVRQREAEPMNTAVLNEDLKRIWKLGLFQDVKLQAEPVPGGVALAFKVVERPLIQEVRFFGNKQVGDGALRDKCGLEPKQTLDQDKLAAGVRAIEALYKEKNYYAAEVRVDTNPGKLEGEVVVNFRVNEGNKMKVEVINVRGNKVFSASRIKGAMKDTREAGWFTGGNYDPDKVFADYEAVLKLYAREGYAKARLEGVSLAEWGDKGREVVRASTTFDEANKRILLDLSVNEGPKYRLAGIKITGTTHFTEEELLGKMRSPQGKSFNQDHWDEDLARLRAAFTEKGYIYANVSPEFSWDDEAGTLEVAITVVENSKAYIERIDIRGNEVTKDKVIRRVLTLEPGDAFDTETVNRDKMRIFNLGFFENVAIDTQPGSDMDKLVLIYDVSPERKTGTLSLGAGYSSVEGLVGFLQVSQNNLFGNGQAVSAQWDFGDRKSSYSLSFTEPWLMDKPVSFGIDIYRILRTQSYASQGFDQTSTGGSLRLGYRFRDAWDAWQVFNTYRYQSDEYSNISPGLQINAGQENISSITPSVVRDSRDNIFDASRGSYNIFSLTMAGGYLGGDRHFIKPVYDTRLHFTTPAIFGWQWLQRFVLGFRGRVGYATPYDAGTGLSEVPISERFYMGGTDTVRGYLERSLGGQVSLRGGHFTLLNNIEYGFKPAPPIKLRAFYDSGNIWDSVEDVNWERPYLYPSVGFGMLFTIPTSVIQIRLDWGYGLDPTERDPNGRIHFNIGNIF
jgi:outer membrane protein insertion porin family